MRGLWDGVRWYAFTAALGFPFFLGTYFLGVRFAEAAVGVGLLLSFGALFREARNRH